MALYLVVAHQTAASPELIGALKGIAAEDGDAEFVLLVPATPISHLLTWVEDGSRDQARKTAWLAARRLRDEGLDLCDVVVGPADPLDAVAVEHQSRGRAYKATVVSTLPLGISRWLKRDLPNRLRNELGLEVLHVVSRQPSYAAA